MFFIKSPHLRISKIILFWIECHLIMKKCSSGLHQFESEAPVGTYLRIRDIRTFRSILIFFDHGVVVPGLFGKTTPAFVVVLFSKESDRNSLYGPRIMNSITISIQFFRPNTSEMLSFQPSIPLHSNSTKKLDFVIYCECKTNDLLNT